MKSKIEETKKINKSKINDKTTRPKEKSKQRILNAAARLFAEKGYDATGIREICFDANANICMVSYFWGGKKALYDGIISDLAEREISFVKKNLTIVNDFNSYKKSEKIDLLFEVLDKIVDFLYGGWISNEMFRFLIQEQQNKRIKTKSPLFSYLKDVIATIFNKKSSDKEVIFKTLFIISQIISPKIFPTYSLNCMKQKSFKSDDIDIIRNNVKMFANSLVK